MDCRLVPLLSSGLDGSAETSDTDPSVAEAAGTGGARSEGAVDAMRSDAAVAWRKAAARTASTVLRSAPPQLGHEAIMRPVTEPLAPLLCVHPAAGRSGVAVGPHPLSCRATVDAELVVQVSEGALHEVVLLLSSLLRGSGAPRHVVAALPPSVSSARPLTCSPVSPRV